MFGPLILLGLLTSAPNAAASPTITIVGDVNFAGYSSDLPALVPLGRVAPLLVSDLRIANAEGLLTDAPVAAYREARLDITAPSVMARHFGAFDLIGLANNHTWDGGTDGLKAQLDVFADLRLATFGAGPTQARAYAPTRFRLEGERLVPAPDTTAPCVSVLGATLKSNRPARPGAHAALVTTDTTRAEVLAQVRAEHDRGCFVLVSLHGGKEGASHPDPKTRAFGLALLDAGADLVAAHHPHVLQGVELRKGLRLQAIAWSLGNFVFRNRTPEKRQTAVLHLTLTKEGERLVLAQLSLLPVHSDKDLLPRPATPREAQAITRLIAERSERYGTHVTLSGDRIELR